MICHCTVFQSSDVLCCVGNIKY